MEKQKTNDLIFQANNIICGRYKLGTNEMKIVLNFINLIEQKDSDFWTYTIPFKTFNMEYSVLKKAARKLMNKPAIEIPKENNPNLPKDEQSFLFAHWFADIEYKKGFIEASFSPKLKPYFLALKDNFTAYNLRYILPLQGAYTIRLYQILKSEQWKRNKVTYSLEWLYDTLQVPKSYMDYMQFNRRVLKQADKELREHTDIYFIAEAIKDGKKVIELTFSIYANKENQIFELNKEAAKFKKIIAPQYVGTEIIEYNGRKFIVDENLNLKDCEPSQAMEVWQYILKNKDKLLDRTLPFNNGLDLKFKEISDKYKIKNFDDELEQFKNFNNDNPKRINLNNWTNWCKQYQMHKNKKSAKNTSSEQKNYTWDFRKAEKISNEIKNFLEFEKGIKWLEDYYLKDIPIPGVGWQDVMHPHLNKEEIILFKLDSEHEQFMINYQSDDILEVEVVNDEKD